jgi:hypothetical protein
VPGTHGGQQLCLELCHVSIHIRLCFQIFLGGEFCCTNDAGGFCYGRWHIGLAGLHGFGGVTGFSHLGRLGYRRCGGRFDQSDGFVHGVTALPLQVKDLGDAGLAGHAGFEVLQLAQGFVAGVWRSSRGGELGLHFGNFFVDGEQCTFTLLLGQLLIDCGDGGQQELDAVDLAVGFRVVADLGELGQRSGGLGTLFKASRLSVKARKPSSSLRQAVICVL